MIANDDYYYSPSESSWSVHPDLEAGLLSPADDGDCDQYDEYYDEYAATTGSDGGDESIVDSESPPTFNTVNNDKMVARSIFTGVPVIPDVPKDNNGDENLLVLQQVPSTTTTTTTITAWKRTCGMIVLGSVLFGFLSISREAWFALDDRTVYFIADNLPEHLSFDEERLFCFLWDVRNSNKTSSSFSLAADNAYRSCQQIMQEGAKAPAEERWR